MDIYLQGMRDRSMLGGTELVREIKVTDWSMARNLSNRSSGVQIPRDICTCLKRYLYSAKCSWIINVCMYVDRITHQPFSYCTCKPCLASNSCAHASCFQGKNNQPWQTYRRVGIQKVFDKFLQFFIFVLSQIIYQML